MLRNLLLSLCILLTSNLLVFSQSGTISGTITDASTGEALPFANIVAELGGTQIGGASSDIDGRFTIKPIQPGTYNVVATYAGYQKAIYESVVVKADKITELDIELNSTAVALKEVEIKTYKVPVFDKDQTVQETTVTSEEIEKMPNRNANAVATTVGGVFSRDGERGSVRGARPEGTVMYIDGIRVTGSSSLPPSAIEQVSVVLGGIPAKYGDASSVINVTTKGPSRQFGAGFELESSQFLDAFGYNRLGFNVNGPLFTKKNERGEVVSSLLGFFIAGDATYREDGNPSAIGIYKATPGTQQYIEENPLRPSGLSGGGTFLNAEFLRQDDFEHVKTTQNTSRYNVNLSGKIDVRTTETTTLTFGGQFNYSDNNGYSYRGSLFNYDKNTHITNQTWRVFGRFTQRFKTDEEKDPLISNVYYSIQADYSQFHSVFEDPDHKDNIFHYGYLGDFTVHKTPTYELGADTINGQAYQNVWLLNSWDFDTLVTFEPGRYNPLVAEWTSTYYDLFAGRPEGNYMNFDQIQLGGGLINGQGPDAIYGLYQSPGQIQSGYGVTDNSQIGINGSFAADIGNHEFQFGLQYEQRIQRNYAYAATPLWTLMNGLTNFHIREIDRNNPELVYVDGVFQDTIRYPRKYDANSQRYFDINLRKKLGLPVDGLDYIVINSYDVANNSITYYDANGKMQEIFLEEDIFSIDMFSPDELLNNGNYRVAYQGFDYTGKKLTSKPSFSDFFNEQNEDGIYTRPIGAFEPIYMAGYIQDKFAFEDLIFNVGVRVDRYDANQPILKDPYLLYPARTVNEVSEIDGVPVNHPGNMGDNYIVYVDNLNNPSQIVGYRDGDNWFNADGFEIQDITALSGSTGINPYLVNPNQDRINAESFKDYEPQISVMPRISFSFPISDQANFFAHYDVLTQRPTSNVIVSPADYWFFNNIGGVINNPNLKPTKTIDYEIGFKQLLTQSSAISITSFYREMRDMIQIFRYYGAYPRDYTSYSNLDFGTVKGLTVTYDLRRTKGARVRAAYTLQFADATGSSPTTAAALVAAGLPNLRTTVPMPWDRRHQINLLLDYRFAEAHGNVTTPFAKKVLNNSGFSLTFNGGSGTPYTASRNIRSPISGGNNLLKGTYFGSRLPWQFRMDARIDKEFFFGSENNGRRSYLNVYLQVLNVLDTKNVINVYPFTGNADDDGYLAAAEWQSEIEEQLDPQSFRDYYSMFVNNPGNYSSPRMIRLGLIFNF
ncbi:MAG: carboxypeptidase regulatory-like domain-containing protein [Bacteroidales bacterium]|nr:carboxypeptidase regulatory-like domain-containing protein [Bacteroidales bacterium]MCF8350909.1 carboxypeptidase regulatory-like domain-containing protein [Bacteroidales bacterium]MCF8375783.1 carboxypeptidase regulatory-like domain-containing protein [Bacteroidales bacterium]MCF8401535.1 carboxypeptidase regulatory-like domain-containing protein [Bacteroidales bacterium]